MRFTLTFHDYMQQYLDNIESEHRHCPVCYEQLMTLDNMRDDLDHLTYCYKHDVIMRHLEKYVRATGDIPDDLEEYVWGMAQLAQKEILRCCESLKI